MFYGPRGMTLDLRDGPDLFFGSGEAAADKWMAAARVLAEPSAEGAVYLDLRIPGRVAAGGVGPIEPEPTPSRVPRVLPRTLNLRVRIGQFSTSSRDFAVCKRRCRGSVALTSGTNPPNVLQSETQTGASETLDSNSRSGQNPWKLAAISR